MSRYYILQGKEPIPVDDVIEWAKWSESADRRVAFTQIPGKEPWEDIEVSTVFLGLDHSFGKGEPLIFETMVFGGPLDQEQIRYSTWDEAEQGHELMVEKVRKVI